MVGGKKKMLYQAGWGLKVQEESAAGVYLRGERVGFAESVGDNVGADEGLIAPLIRVWGGAGG